MALRVGFRIPIMPNPTNLLNSIPHVGVLALGVFIGFLLGFVLLQSKPTVKAAITVIGGALGGTPIAFMKDVGAAKWFYPIGLLVGLFFVRVPRAREAIGLKYDDPTPKNNVHGYFAWLDLFASAILIRLTSRKGNLCTLRSSARCLPLSLPRLGT